MSPLGLALANWLRTAPGPIEGDTFEDCLRNAHEISGLSRHFSADDFAVGLSRVGYAPQNRTRHGDGNGASYWILCLPEASLPRR